METVQKLSLIETVLTMVPFWQMTPIIVAGAFYGASAARKSRASHFLINVFLSDTWAPTVCKTTAFWAPFFKRCWAISLHPFEVQLLSLHSMEAASRNRQSLQALGFLDLQSTRNNGLKTRYFGYKVNYFGYFGALGWSSEHRPWGSKRAQSRSRLETSGHIKYVSQQKGTHYLYT